MTGKDKGRHKQPPRDRKPKVTPAEPIKKVPKLEVLAADGSRYDELIKIRVVETEFGSIYVANMETLIGLPYLFYGASRLPNKAEVRLMGVRSFPNMQTTASWQEWYEKRPDGSWTGTINEKRANELRVPYNGPRTKYTFQPETLEARTFDALLNYKPRA